MQANNKLKKNEEFRQVYSKGKSMANKLLIIYITNNNIDEVRVGFTISKKVGNSVIRSRVKRLMKEGFRLNVDKIKKGHDIVFVARTTAKDKSYREIESAMLHLLRKMKLIIG